MYNAHKKPSVSAETERQTWQAIKYIEYGIWRFFVTIRQQQKPRVVYRHRQLTVKHEPDWDLTAHYTEVYGLRTETSIDEHGMKTAGSDCSLPAQ